MPYELLTTYCRNALGDYPATRLKAAADEHIAQDCTMSEIRQERTWPTLHVTICRHPGRSRIFGSTQSGAGMRCSLCGPTGKRRGCVVTVDLGFNMCVFTR